ncbi:MAG: redoxin family protein [Armatimonadota bacterium]
MSESQRIRAGGYARVRAALGAVALLLIGSFTLGQMNRQFKPGRWVTTEGAIFDPFVPKEQPLVLLFVLTDCPIANMFAPELKRIIKHYGEKGVQFSVVYADTNLNREDAKRHARDYGLDCTLVLDSIHSLAKRAGATVSPEAVVISKGGQIIYRGRIDDRAVDFGKIRAEPKHFDLRVALDLTLLRKPIKMSRTKAVGCIFRTEKS